ncbi:hypothetical protein B0J18DRAFT_449287 [Chaetomium sp. MPI-SDFR-AT-0129]|nr:hypothetical protein B0J18DRAFT_449287 [Chaetomium sp. MPI-SDFR-AT-0129]
MPLKYTNTTQMAQKPYFVLNPWPVWFRGLLYTCRLVYTEVVALLYSANLFVLHFADARTLKPLNTLSPSALSSLTALKIVLNQASCHHRFMKSTDHDCCGGRCVEKTSCATHCGRHQRPFLTIPKEGENEQDDDDEVYLDDRDREWRKFVRSSNKEAYDPILMPVNHEAKKDPETEARLVLQRWRATVQNIARHIMPDRLKLSFVCDINPEHTGAVDLANALLESLSVLPVLKSCDIRLSKEPDARLSRMAHDTSVQLCGIRRPYLTPTVGRTTFVTLPRELRLRILEYTNLITPSKEVWWSRHEGRYSWRALSRGHRYYNDDGWLRYDECSDLGRCTFRNTSARKVPLGSPAGCFCTRRHGAYSSLCPCWAAPGPALFLVCRTLCQDAQLVFFSGNRFVIHDLSTSCDAEYSLRYHWTALMQEGPELPRDITYPHGRLAASIFFRDIIPPHCISYLRSLEMSFPARLERGWPTPDCSAMQDWRETVDWLANRINGPGLTLGFVEAELIDYHGPGEVDIITEEEADMLHNSILAILTPFKQLVQGPNALGRFYAQVTYPWEWTASSDDRWTKLLDQRGDPWGVRRELTRLHNRTLETLVMGDQYHEMFADGKRAPPRLSVFKQVMDFPN